jgi:hypothetical protein
MPAVAGLSDAGASARLAVATATRRVFVARRDNDELCLIVEDDAEQSSTVDCASRSVLKTGAIFISTPDYATKTVDVVAVVGDGVKAVSAEGANAAVVNNVAILPRLNGRLITLIGANSVQSAVDLGPQF